jgi:hypothetical protein
MRVTVSGDLNGEYIVEEIREDGSAVLRPDLGEKQGVTSYPAIVARAPGRPLTAVEFEEHFGDLPTDDEP